MKDIHELREIVLSLLPRVSSFRVWTPHYASMHVPVIDVLLGEQTNTFNKRRSTLFRKLLYGMEKAAKLVKSVKSVFRQH
jgi:hypothetical protein